MANERDDLLLRANSSLEWMREFRDAGDWDRYRTEEVGIIPILDRLGVTLEGRADGEIDTFKTIDNITGMHLRRPSALDRRIADPK